VRSCKTALGRHIYELSRSRQQLSRGPQQNKIQKGEMPIQTPAMRVNEVHVPKHLHARNGYVTMYYCTYIFDNTCVSPLIALEGRKAAALDRACVAQPIQSICCIPIQSANGQSACTMPTIPSGVPTSMTSGWHQLPDRLRGLTILASKTAGPGFLFHGVTDSKLAWGDGIFWGSGLEPQVPVFLNLT
jgi:hypothetical protein